VAATVAYPKLHNFSLAGWSVGGLLKKLELHRIPMLLPFGQTSWEEVERLCAAHPDLPLIVLDVNYRQLRFLLPLWESYRNLYVDLSWFSIHDGLSYLVERKLIGQVIFGTAYPRYAPGAAITMVTYADIPESAGRQVAGGTLRAIIKRIRRDVR
jgi:predicted TIM-barrel fold metal-dependent hydrolase